MTSYASDLASSTEYFPCLRFGGMHTWGPRPFFRDTLRIKFIDAALKRNLSRAIRSMALWSASQLRSPSLKMAKSLT